MAVPWTVRLADRTNLFVLPGVWVVASIGYFYGVFALNDGPSHAWETREQAWGTALTYCLITGYLWACMVYSWRMTNRTLADLAGVFSSPERWQQRVQQPPTALVAGFLLVGTAYGLSQNARLIQTIDLSPNLWLDVSMIVANAIMFATIGMLLGRRLFAHSGLLKAGYDANVDVYDLLPLRPFASIALVDVLIVMGALAFMPLQALDAEFRWVNYEAGFAIGIPAIIAFFLLPMWGIHRRIQMHQSARLDEIQTAVNGCDRRDIATLERLVAHRDRVKSIHTWPLDLRHVSRAAFYMVIPPLAWVGAALVENVVERFL